MRVVKVRHNEIMHNVTHSSLDINATTELIKNYVVPWLKDFTAMFIYSYQYRQSNNKNRAQFPIEDFWPILESMIGIDENQPVSYIHYMALNYSRQLHNGDSKSIDNDLTSSWLTVLGIVASNRLLKSNDVIPIYNDSAKPMLMQIEEPSISTAIYHEMAYRNLRNFKEVATMSGYHDLSIKYNELTF